MVTLVPSIGTPALWAGFLLFIVFMLAIDLFVARRGTRASGHKESLAWSAGWIALALLFFLGVRQLAGGEKALEFLTGYVVEKALSIDNLFLFIVIFSFFSVPKTYQHRVLFYGILGAIVTRAIFIFLGTELLAHFSWIMYIFGVIVIAAAIRLCFQKSEPADLANNTIVILVKKILPVTDKYHAGKFFVRLDGKLFATPLFLVLIVIEATDVLFALDSIPAVFAITRDPFIVFTSNIFAILGLRSLFFLIAAALRRLVFLHYGLAVVLAFVGAKMLTSDFFSVSTGLSLAIILGTLVVTAVISLRYEKKNASHSTHL